MKKFYMLSEKQKYNFPTLSLTLFWHFVEKETINLEQNLTKCSEQM